MKVSQLIDILSKEDPNKNVSLCIKDYYDSELEIDIYCTKDNLDIYNIYEEDGLIVIGDY